MVCSYIRLEMKMTKELNLIPHAALMYLFSIGWELYETGTAPNQDQFYWIMRRPCTKDEFDKAVKKSIW